MKKIIGFVLTLFTVATLFAAARPSLDGRALVADPGSMPKGLFARTIGYLPGDSVAVTNPATGSSVDVLILGAIDPSEGVAILLSPEAASKLNITKDSNVQVKITKRSGSLDEIASGAAVVSESSAYAGGSDSFSESENPIEDISSVGADKNGVTMKSLLDEPVNPPVGVVIPPETESEPSAEENEIPAEQNAERENVVVVEIPSDAASEENLSEDMMAEDVPSEPEYEPEAVAMAEDTGYVEEEPVEAELFDPYAEENNAVPEDRIVFIDAPGEPAGDAPVVAKEENPSVEEEPPVEEEAYLGGIAEMIKPVEEEEPPVEEEAIAEYVDETAPEVAPEYEEPAPSEKVAEEEVPEPEAEQEIVEAEDIPEVPAVAENTEPEEENTEEEPNPDEGAYQPIVLVPAGENPPVAEDEPALEDAMIAPEPVSEEAVAETEPAEDSDTELVVSAPKVPVTEDFIVPSLKDLKSGSYYVQIASLGATEHVDGLLAKYSEKYPMVVVPLSSGKAYQVMVGPLTTDEYTVVQEKFRAFGFKDAFLRKIR